MEMIRFISAEQSKGKAYYLNTQRNYESIKTITYFALSFLIFLIGLLSTKSRANLLTVVSVLGCLPACKSLVETIMFFRFNSLKKEYTQQLLKIAIPFPQAFDMVFTSYNESFQVGHLFVLDNQIVGFTETKDFKESDFTSHIKKICAAEGYKDLSVKIFTDFKKYVDRMDELKGKRSEAEASSSVDYKKEKGILGVLKSVTL